MKHGESHARIDATERGRWSGPLGEEFTVRECDVAERGTAAPDIRVAIGIEREYPGVPFIVVALVCDFEHRHEALVEECVLEPAIHEAAGRAVAERRQAD